MKHGIRNVTDLGKSFSSWFLFSPWVLKSELNPVSQPEHALAHPLFTLSLYSFWDMFD